MENKIIRAALKNLASAPELARTKTLADFESERDKEQVNLLFDALRRYNIKPFRTAPNGTEGGQNENTH